MRLPLGLSGCSEPYVVDLYKAVGVFVQNGPCLCSLCPVRNHVGVIHGEKTKHFSGMWVMLSYVSNCVHVSSVQR